MRKQYTLAYSQFTPVSLGNSYLFTQFEAIDNFVSAHCRGELHHLLLKPIKRQSEVDFWSEDGREYQTIDKLSNDQRQDVLKRYNAAIYEMHQFAKQLMIGVGEEDYKWGEIILKAFDSNTHILLSDGNQFSMVWGWQFANKALYELPFEAYSSFILMDFLPPVETEDKVLDEIEPIVETPESEPDFSVVNEDESTTTHTQHEPSPKEEKKVTTIKRPPITPTSNGFTRFLDGTERFGKKYWWLVLLIFIILLFFLLRGCEGNGIKPASEMNPDELNDAYRDIIPPNQGVRIHPVDPKDIIDDDDSKSKVVGNVLNIALKKKTDNFQHFSVDLKQAFPDEKYQIVYFDEQTRRLQFEFPEEERQSMKDKIRSALGTYDLLIWDEAVFNSVKTFNDPSFQDNQKIMPWNLITVPAAWELTTGDTSVVIAVIDDGFDINHVELKSHLVKPYNVITHNNVITCGPDRKHGTHVAGIIGAAANNGKGITGVAPNCRIMPIQASGPQGGFLMTDVVDGILYAIKNNADVINMSLGKYYNDDVLQLSPNEQSQLINQYGKDESEFWNELFQMAEDNKVTIVIAAGNQKVIVGMDPMQRSNKVIKIAACDNNKNSADFSNYFPTISANGSCLSAPGVNIFSTLPGNQYGYMDGTSMASPMVAGAIGLMKSVNKNLTNKQIMRILFDTGYFNQSQKIGPIIQVDNALRKSRGL